jgi:Flp pilus assembly protein TadG
MVEFVLLLPLLLAIVFAIIEFAIAWRTYQIITNVAREGARLAVVTRGSAKATTVQTRIDNLLTQSNLASTISPIASVTYSCDGAPGGLCASTGQSDGVQIDYDHTFVFLGPVLNLMCLGCGNSYATITLTSLSVMRTE